MATRYTAVFEFEDGKEPSVGAKDTWLGGRLVSCSFSDEMERLEKMESVLRRHVDDLIGVAIIFRENNMHGSADETEAWVEELIEYL